MPRVLVICDDLELRKRLASILPSQFWMTLPEWSESATATEAIQQFHPDILVIEAELKGRSGLDIAEEALQSSELAAIAIARSESLAARAFDIGLVDYIVQPMASDRLERAVQRAMKVIFNGSSKEMPAIAQSQARLRARLRVKSSKGFLFLNCEELLWAEAAGNYVNLHCCDRTYKVREPIASINARLEELNFLRIHRSIIVNTGCVREVRYWGAGDCVVVLPNGKELPVSRSYRHQVEEWIYRDDNEPSSKVEEQHTGGVADEGNEQSPALN